MSLDLLCLSANASEAPPSCRIPFAAHGLNSLPWWSNEDQAGFCTIPCECGVLAQLQTVSISKREDLSQCILQIHSRDVCPDSLAPEQSLLCDLHQDMRMHLRGLQHTGSSRRAASGRLGPCRGSSFECHILTQFDRLGLDIKLVKWHWQSRRLSYRAISPRFAMRTEVSGLTTGVVVEL